MPRTERLSVERKPKSAFKTIARISQYMLHKKWMLALSVVFVLISAGAGVAGTYFLKPLINDGILPLVNGFRAFRANDLGYEHYLFDWGFVVLYLQFAHDQGF